MSTGTPPMRSSPSTSITPSSTAVRTRSPTPKTPPPLENACGVSVVGALVEPKENKLLAASNDARGTSSPSQRLPRLQSQRVVVRAGLAQPRVRPDAATLAPELAHVLLAGVDEAEAALNRGRPASDATQRLAHV
jgi:hypothetical protein